ncbi:hypothetical protein KJZ63_03845 [Patescibacteria group bacterium]|nr:hypothetical protein [Patescibacteria group bacterium]
MIEKERVKQLAQEKYQEALRGLEDDLLDIEEEPDEAERKLLAEGARKNFGRRIINALYGVAGGGNPEFKRAWDEGNTAAKQEIANAIKEFLIEIYPILDTEGVIAANATHIIRDIASDPETANERVVPTVNYEALTPEEIASLPEKVREELEPFLELHGYLVGYDAATPDELDAIKDLIEESLSKTPKTDIIKFVIRLRLMLGGLGRVDQTKLKNFLNGVINKAKAILAPPVRTNAPAPNNAGTGTPVNPNLAPRNTGEYEPDPYPEHYNRTQFRNYLLEQFEKAVEQNGDDAAYRYLVRTANSIMNDFLDSGSAQGSSKFGEEFLAMWDALKDFNPSKIDAQKARSANIKEWGKKPARYENDSVVLHRYELAQKLRDKGLELLFLSYIAEFAIKHGSPKSLVSDWSHLLQMEKADTDNFGTGVDMFDFFLSDGKEKGPGSYKHSNVFTYLMWKLPEMIREVEKELGSWNDGYPVAHSDRLKKAIADEIKRLRQATSHGNGRYEVTINQHKKPTDKRGRWDIDNAKFTFSSSDFDELGDQDIETSNLVKYIELYGTATGVRQHLFLNDLARGSTPGGAMNDNKEWMVKCSRFALANYQCYKGAVPHPLTEGFEVSWPAKLKDGTPYFNPKQSVIITSILQTESVLSRVMKIRQERVNLGLLQDNESLSDVRFPLETAYPDLYSFIVRAHQKRTMGGWVFDKDGNVQYEDEYEYKMIRLADGRLVRELNDKNEPIKLGVKLDRAGNVVKKRDAEGNLVPKRGDKYPAKFEAFIAGLNAMDEFVTAALIVPGGVSDKEKIKSQDPHHLREAMLKDLVTLIQNKVSPLKSNEAWVNWRHVAQYILMFVDRMYRVYKLCDDTPDGRALLTHEIRQKFASESYNLILTNVPAWIKNEKDLVAAPEYEHGQAVKVAGMSKQVSDPRFAGVALGESHEAASAKRELDIRDWILSRLPEIDEHRLVSIGPKARPLTGRIIGQIRGPQIDRDNSVQRVRGPVGSAFEAKGVLALDNLMHNGSDAFSNVWYDYVNEGAIPNFQKGIWQVIIGTPAAEQKSVADEKK